MTILVLRKERRKVFSEALLAARSPDAVVGNKHRILRIAPIAMKLLVNHRSKTNDCNRVNIFVLPAPFRVVSNG